MIKKPSILRKKFSTKQVTNLPAINKAKQRAKRRFIKSGILAFNFVLLLGVGIFLFTNKSASPTVRQNTLSSVIQAASSVQNPLDQLSSAEIAAQTASLTALPEFTAIRNQADSENALLSVVPSDNDTIAKPQIVATGLKSKKQITSYIVKAGDSIPSIADKFGLSKTSVQWSNNITGDKVEPGRQLVIPPGNGIAYKVKSGDTIDIIVNRYRADKSLFITVNDVETGQLNVNEFVWIPNGTVANSVRSFNFPFGSRAIYSGNGYDYGYCTWWAATRRAQVGKPIPSNFGNACTWKNLAQRAGLPVGTTPAVHAVIWTNSGCYGHVGFVEAVNADGSVWVSDMNSRGYAAMDVNSGSAGGWNHISYRLLDPVKASNFWYIY